MTLTRWKLMAGVLGLTMCGLAALAEPACRTVGYTARQQPISPPLPAVDTGSKPLPPPLPVDPPKPAALPSPFPAGTEVPSPLPLPSGGVTTPVAKVPAPELPSPGLPLPPAVNPFADSPKPLPAPAPTPFAEAPKPLAPVGEPKVVPGGMDEKGFTDLAKSQLKQIPLPSLDTKPEAPPLPLSRPPEVTFREPNLVSPTGDFPKPDVPRPVLVPPLPSPIFTLPPPAVTVTEKAWKPESPKLDLPAPTAEPKPDGGFKPTLPAATPATPTAETLLPAPSPVVTPKPTEKVETLPVSATVSADRKLKVLLCLGAGKPWFEVRDGEELVLKVVSDAVEVKAPATNGDAADVLKASGRVSFRTLGGNGTCDELRVTPGTGEVVVSGKVVVTSNWGKAETTATADKMTFRLSGEAAGMRK